MLAASQNRTWWTLFKARNLNPCCMMIIGRGNERYVNAHLVAISSISISEIVPLRHRLQLTHQNWCVASDTLFHLMRSCAEVNTKSNFLSFSSDSTQDGWSSRRWNRRPKVNFNRSRPVKVVWQKFISRSSELEGIGSKIEKCLDFKVI